MEEKRKGNGNGSENEVKVYEKEKMVCDQVRKRREDEEKGRRGGARKRIKLRRSKREVSRKRRM